VVVSVVGVFGGWGYGYGYGMEQRQHKAARQAPGKHAWAHLYSGVHDRLGNSMDDADCGVVLQAKTCEG
jgi:hypothetical protein